MIDIVKLLEDELIKELQNSKQTITVWIKCIGDPKDNVMEISMNTIN